METPKFSVKSRLATSLLATALCLFAQKPTLADSNTSRNSQTLQSMGAHDLTTNEQTREIFVIDTGVNRANMQIDQSIIDESCFSFERKCSDDHSYAESSNCATAIDGCLHGTAVTSIFADAGARVHFVQIFAADDAIKALEQVASSPHNKGAVVNMSIGFDPLDSEDCTWRLPRWQKVLSQLVSSDITLVVPAGNREHKNSVLWPWCVSPNGHHLADGVIVVSATDATNANMADYTSFSSRFTSIVAPGTALVLWDGKWVESSGTSFAAPLLAIALLGARDDANLSVKSLEKNLRSTAQQRFDEILNLAYLFPRIDLLRNHHAANQVFLPKIESHN